MKQSSGSAHSLNHESERDEADFAAEGDGAHALAVRAEGEGRERAAGWSAGRGCALGHNEIAPVAGGWRRCRERASARALPRSVVVASDESAAISSPIRRRWR